MVNVAEVDGQDLQCVLPEARALFRTHVSPFNTWDHSQCRLISFRLLTMHAKLKCRLGRDQMVVKTTRCTIVLLGSPLEIIMSLREYVYCMDTHMQRVIVPTS
jgi:hypothetical protein